MVRLDLDWIEKCPFRAVIACAARSAKRTLPLAAETGADLSLCRNSIEISRAFAAGIPVETSLLSDAIELLFKQVDQGGAAKAVAARAAILELAKCASSGAQILLFADQFPHALTGMISRERPAAYKAARNVLLAAWDAATIPSEANGEEPIVSQVDAEWARQAIQHDLKVLLAFPSSEEDWLGSPVDTGDEGRFGELWRHGTAPQWYAPIELPIEIYVTESETDDFEIAPQKPDIICWFFSNAQRIKMKPLRENICTLVRKATDKGELSPVLVVYAPGIGKAAAAELISEGATVLDNRVAGKVPTNAFELREATRLMMFNSGPNWVRGEFWKNAQNRIAEPASKLFQKDRSWRPEDEIAGSAVDYRSITECARPAKERKRTKRGWPIDI